MNTLETKFANACALMHRPRLAKLATPGIWTFVRRHAARNGLGSGPVSTRLFFGKQMTVVLPEVTSEALYTYGMFDEAVTWMIMKSVSTGQSVLDVGAHFGYCTLLMSHLVGEKGRVLALEPTPSTFEILSSNVAELSNVEAVNFAAGDQEGTVAISDYGVRYSAWNTLTPSSRLPEILGTSAKSVPVKLARLDKLCEERQLRPQFIKVDAENFEDHVVSGLGDMLATIKPTILLETGSPQGLAAARNLLEFGYRPRVSEGAGSLNEWNDSIESANARFKDILFSAPEAKLNNGH